MKENYSKVLHNFSPLKNTYLGKTIISISLALSKKNEIEKCPLITSFQCSIEGGIEKSVARITVWHHEDKQ